MQIRFVIVMSAFIFVAFFTHPMKRVGNVLPGPGPKRHNEGYKGQESTSEREREIVFDNFVYAQQFWVLGTDQIQKLHNDFVKNARVDWQDPIAVKLQEYYNFVMDKKRLPLMFCSGEGTMVLR